MLIEFIRRRIKWRENHCFVEFSDNVTLLFNWDSKSLEYDDALKELVPLEHPEWHLHIAGEETQEFKSEEALKCHIIRTTYDIQHLVLIPSELLYDAGLVYVTNRWVDTWSGYGSIPVEARVPLPTKPKNRNINLPTQPGEAAALYRKSRERRQEARDELMALNQEPDDYPDEIRQHNRSQLCNVKRPPGLPVVEDGHRTSLRIVPRQTQKRPSGPRRLHKGDDMELTWQEEQDVWIADWQGAGLDEYDLLDDDECYYVLETGECDAQTCAIVTIDPETPAGEEGPSQVQNARPPSKAEASELHESDFHRFG